MSGPTYTAPSDAGDVALGRTLPELLYDACEAYENPQALNQPTGEGWEPLSLDQFRVQSEETALGLLDLGLERGDRVALLLESDVPFCIVDMGCLIAGLIDVPLYLSSSADQMQYIAGHSEAKALAVANPKRLEQAAEVLPDLPEIETVILCDTGEESGLPELPDRVDLVTLDEIRTRGRTATDDQDAHIQRLRDQIDADDLATTIYTSGTTGQPKGVMLSHENISSNAVNSVGELSDFETGAEGEVVLSFLPLTHVFARMLQYSFMMRGVSIYFTHPDDLVEALPKVRPTAFASVPRVLEKVYAGIRKKILGLEGLQRTIGDWALDLAQEYEMDESMSGVYKMKRAVADRLVFKKWRASLGGRVKWIVVGGAALQPDLANTLAAAGIPTIQGYGLTETSPVIAFTRPQRTKPGTVGEPIPGVEVRIADDGEILTRGPHVMQGYYKRPDKTDEVLTEEGWFHTGDVGEVNEQGFLKITDRKKDLFKLSTGKYVMPQPIENQLGSQPLVDKAVVVGNDRKFCAALIFPTEDQVRAEAEERGLDPEGAFKKLLKSPEIVDAFRTLVMEANEGLDHWATVKRFALVPDELTIESGLLTPTLKVKRPQIQKTFGTEIDALYYEDEAPEELTERGAVIASL
ncbi:MAG: long-chain fatty acid--CoA ligase [Bacteroidetes bacterium SW_9_63_38]|nr:MAG: long-chain fatty acid--CoA ligase [Bacteroidetes bacterium SW_9_63_38]